MLQNDLKLKELTSLPAFKYKMKKMEAGSQKCEWLCYVTCLLTFSLF